MARSTRQISITKMQLARSNSPIASGTIMTVMVIYMVITIIIETNNTMI